jgi:hypothetical protein
MRMHAARPWNGPRHELAADIPVEAGPVQIGQRLPQQGRDVGHVGDRIGLAVGQRVGGLEELAVELGLVVGGDLEVVHGFPFVTLNLFQGPVLHPQRGAPLDAETSSA